MISYEKIWSLTKKKSKFLAVQKRGFQETETVQKTGGTGPGYKSLRSIYIYSRVSKHNYCQFIAFTKYSSPGEKSILKRSNS